MDCGEEFKPTLLHGTPTPYKCLYWGTLNPSMKYEYFLSFPITQLMHPPKTTWYARLFKKIVPCYHHTYENPTVKPITARWLLQMRKWGTLIIDPMYRKLENSEMWTCHECFAKREEVFDSLP